MIGDGEDMKRARRAGHQIPRQGVFDLGPSIEFVPCELCDTPTRHKGTKRCDRCWELETRIHMDPGLARKIIAKLK